MSQNYLVLQMFFSVWNSTVSVEWWWLSGNWSNSVIPKMFLTVSLVLFKTVFLVMSCLWIKVIFLIVIWNNCEYTLSRLISFLPTLGSERSLRNLVCEVHCEMCDHLYMHHSLYISNKKWEIFGLKRFLSFVSFWTFPICSFNYLLS
jgi:hypothetical protein